MATPVLQFKRGLATNVGLASFRAGEPGFVTDEYNFYIGVDGTAANQKFFGSSRYWTKETASAGGGVNLISAHAVGAAGTHITLAAPATVGAALTYYFPAIQGAVSSVLTNDGSGNLTWASGSANPVFTGVATFTDTTDNTLGDPDTGAVQIDGGLGVNKNVTVGAGLSVVGDVMVAGVSTFVGSVTFNGGTINLGDANTDDINVAGEFVSSLIPNTDATYDIGDAGTPKRWRHAGFSGVGTFSSGAVIGASSGVGTVYVGTAVTENTSFNEALVVDGDARVTGILTIGTGTIIIDGNTNFVGLGTDTPSGDFNSLSLFSRASDPPGEGSFRIAGPLQKIIYGGLDVGLLSGTYSGGVYGLQSPNANSLVSVGIITALTSFTANSGIDVTGHTELDDLNVSGVSTFTGAIDANGDLDVDGHTELDNLNVSGVSTFTGAIDANGGADISGGETTLSSATVSDLTAGRVVLAGTSGAIEDSANLTFDGSTLTVATTIDTTNLEVSNIKAKDGTSSITITDGTGVVGISTNLTVQGDLFVTGSQTQVNTESLLVEDSLIEVGLINSGGNLVPPASDLNIDVGIIFNYYDSAARLAAVYWDDSVSRIALASVVTESSSVLTATTYAGVEIGSLWVNDCAGQSQVISCTGSERFLENITIDAGSF